MKTRFVAMRYDFSCPDTISGRPAPPCWFVTRGRLGRWSLLRALQLLNLVLGLSWLGGCSNGIQAPAQIRYVLNSAGDLDAYWKRFRGAYPLHIQTIAVSDLMPTKSRVIVISEPPPHVTIDQVRKLLPDAQLRQSTVGHDGWIRDIVASVPGDEPRLAAKLGRLSRFLFGTAYKAYAIRKIRSSAPPTMKLNYMVSAHDLQRWLIEKRGRFFPIEGTDGGGQTIDQIAGTAHSSVYFNESGGLVAWWIPSGQAISECHVEARQFAIDSDLIVGAVGEVRGVLILGRERTTALDVMPPLRAETLALLSSVSHGELAQSYERSHVLAGRIDGKHDWAPVYLSPELVDTEYGSLLNVTDQILKGWSESGTIQYEHFPYPSPGRYPFDHTPLSELVMRELNEPSVTFNWNTRGCGYAVAGTNAEVFALNRTGALAVSYIPGEVPRTDAHRKMRGFEDTAYDFFNRQSDGNLARVVQYAALYQIFRAFRVAASPGYAQLSHVPDLELTRVLRSLLSEIRQLDSTGKLDAVEKALYVQSRASRMPDDPFANAPDDKFNRKLHWDYFRSVSASLRSISSGEVGLVAESLAVRSRIADTSTVAGLRNTEDRVAALTKVLTGIVSGLRSPRLPAATLDGRFSPTQRQIILTGMLNKALAPILRPLATIRRAPDQYAKGVAGQSQTWIHTPAIVVSWAVTTDGSRPYGGHNLSSRISRLREDANIPIGSPKLTGKGDNLEISVNPHDVSRVTGLIRDVGRGADDPAELASLLHGAYRMQLARRHVASPRHWTLRKRVELAQHLLVAELAIAVHASPLAIQEATGATEEGLVQTVESPSMGGVLLCPYRHLVAKNIEQNCNNNPDF